MPAASISVSGSPPLPEAAFGRHGCRAAAAHSAANLRACLFASGLALAAMTTPAVAIELSIVEQGDSASTIILLTGKVDAGDGLKMRGFVNGLPSSKPILAQLAFGGGSFSEAMSIGRFFHQSRIRTVVPSKRARCISPCPLVLVAGRDPDTDRPSSMKYSSAVLGFSSIVLNYPEKEYRLKDLNTAVAGTQRNILQIADYLHEIEANINILRYFHSVLKQGDVKYISNEEALDLGIAVLIEETGQVIQPSSPRRN
jgi:hypothetical protein